MFRNNFAMGNAGNAGDPPPGAQGKMFMNLSKNLEVI